MEMIQFIFAVFFGIVVFGLLFGLFSHIYNKKSAKAGPQVVRGKTVKCLACQNETFRTKRVLLNTMWLTYLGMDWLNRSARVLICEECGFMHWYTVK